MVFDRIILFIIIFWVALGSKRIRQSISKRAVYVQCQWALDTLNADTCLRLDTCPYPNGPVIRRFVKSPDHSKTYQFIPQKTILSLTFFHSLYSISDPLPLSSSLSYLSRTVKTHRWTNPYHPQVRLPQPSDLNHPESSRTIIAFLSNHLRRHISRCNPSYFNAQWKSWDWNYWLSNYLLHLRASSLAWDLGGRLHGCGRINGGDEFLEIDSRHFFSRTARHNFVELDYVWMLYHLHTEISLLICSIIPILQPLSPRSSLIVSFWHGDMSLLGGGFLATALFGGGFCRLERELGEERGRGTWTE